MIGTLFGILLLVVTWGSWFLTGVSSVPKRIGVVTPEIIWSDPSMMFWRLAFLILLSKSQKVHMQCATERDLPAMNTPLVYLGSYSIGNPVGVQSVKVWKISFYWIHYPQMFCWSSPASASLCSTVWCVVRVVLVWPCARCGWCCCFFLNPTLPPL